MWRRRNGADEELGSGKAVRHNDPGLVRDGGGHAEVEGLFACGDVVAKVRGRGGGGKRGKVGVARGRRSKVAPVEDDAVRAAEEGVVDRPDVGAKG